MNVGRLHRSLGGSTNLRRHACNSIVCLDCIGLGGYEQSLEGTGESGIRRTVTKDGWDLRGVAICIDGRVDCASYGATNKARCANKTDRYTTEVKLVRMPLISHVILLHICLIFEQ